MLWDKITESVLGIGQGWLSGRQRIAEAKLQSKIAIIESEARIAEAKATAVSQLAMSAQDHSQRWEQMLVEQSGRDWKDEWWTVLVSIPLVMAFVPGFAQYVADGFTNLEQVPDWYLYVVFAAVSFAFARRNLLPALKDIRRKPSQSN